MTKGHMKLIIIIQRQGIAMVTDQGHSCYSDQCHLVTKKYKYAKIILFSFIFVLKFIFFIFFTLIMSKDDLQTI